MIVDAKGVDVVFTVNRDVDVVGVVIGTRASIRAQLVELAKAQSLQLIAMQHRLKSVTMLAQHTLRWERRKKSNKLQCFIFAHNSDPLIGAVQPSDCRVADDQAE